ncbi:thiamine pyrophosphate-binding protein [Cupriavidus pinatubonensis]|uniref:Acetolactate synthase large subunit n=1 Tax=Cupriavidus pinatubonensis TaxID=248026 RepID=A0ABN7ZHR4_9BURK|nr:thiamine pyrophosphate-binding protein [Cupriavidus pinatubonensis]CAG9184998.1 Acetolactate synthase large subunit [Cupriavidus pinatubonensis]
MTGADVLVKLLEQYGVEYIFGVPGDTNVAFYKALNNSSQIKHVMARDERSAVFMADAYARYSGKPGVCECPSGAGAMYSLPGVAEANASSIPLILLTNDIPLKGEGRGMITELDNAKLFEPVTKLSFQVKTTAKIPEAIRRAFRTATAGRPGAVHMTLPEDVLAHASESTDREIYAEKECATFPAFPVRPTEAAIAALAKLLNGAKKPVIVAGGGVNHSHAAQELLTVAQKAQAVVVTTITGQGAIPDTHELALGVIGDNGFHPHAARAVEESDLLVYLGCKMGSVVTIGWTFPTANSERKVVQVDLDSTVLGNTTRNDLSIAGDAKSVLTDLLPLVEAREPRAWNADLNKLREQFWQHAEPLLHSDAVPLKPQRVVQELNRRLPKHAVMVSDAGTPTPHLTRFLRLPGDGSRLVIPRAFGGLGYALPAVVGAWLARPDVRPIGLFGDGSFSMSAGELETLTRLKVPAVLLHFNNGCYGWIKALQKLHNEAQYLSVDFTPLNVAKIAESFGLKGIRATNGDEIAKALDEAFKHDGPVLIDIVSESIVDECPPVYSWLKAIGKDPLAIE